MANLNVSFILQEMEIVLGIPQQDPMFFNLDFLTYTGIIEGDWALVQEPHRTSEASQLDFNNGVVLVAKPTQTLFLESFDGKAMEDLQTPKVAIRFMDIMKNIDFTNLELNFRGHIAFPDAPQAAHDFFFNSLLAPGSWHGVGTAPIRAGLNLVYTLEDRKLNLSVQETSIRRMDETSMAAILFSGTFENDLSLIPSGERFERARQGIQSWESDLKIFIDLVSRFFQSSSSPKSPSPQPNLSVF